MPKIGNTVTAVIDAVKQHLGDTIPEGVTLEATPDIDGLWFVEQTFENNSKFGGTVFYVEISSGTVVEVSASLPPDEQYFEVLRFFRQNKIETGLE